MFHRWFPFGRRITVATIAVAAAGLIAVPSGAATGAGVLDGSARYGRAELREDLEVIRATGVQGRVEGPDGVVEARSGVADAGTGRSVPRNGYFRIGSATKTFVSVAILQLVGEGRLSLADTMDRLLPGVVQGRHNDGAKITLRQVLQHTSGLYDYDWPINSATEYYQHRFDRHDPQTLVKAALQHEPNFEPGAGWSYSNTNYQLAAMIIKRVTGHGWARQVHDRILGPLGLTQTSIPADRPYLPWPHARGYERYEGGPLIDVTTLNPSVGGPAGAMISTPADLNRFWRALLAGRLLAPAQLAQMQQTVPATEWQQAWPGAGYGLGIARFKLACGGDLWNHGGDIEGYSTRDGVTTDGRRAFTISISSGNTGNAEACRRPGHRRLEPR